MRGVGFLMFGMSFFVLSASAGDPANKKFEMTKEEKIIVELTNKERKAKNLPALRPNPLLFKVARDHAANMAKQKKMDHNLDGKTPAQRIKAAGYKYFAQGENIAQGDFKKQAPPLEMLMKGWMDSQGHRENILRDMYTEIGVGLAQDDDGIYYFTQVFGKPRP
jgi:uncharacterized protein YkwD